ncbi:MAG: PEGA domain-containing protein [Deltaproteobacteria bacterium]|nr:PEGA domain-containing protein [Deltaproteobacteria bacterium]
MAGSWFRLLHSTVWLLLFTLSGCLQDSPNTLQVKAVDRKGVPVPLADVYSNGQLLGTTDMDGLTRPRRIPAGVPVLVLKAESEYYISEETRLEWSSLARIGVARLELRPRRTVHVRAVSPSGSQSLRIGVSGVSIHVAREQIGESPLDANEGIVVGESGPDGSITFDMGCDDDEQLVVWGRSEVSASEGEPTVIRFDSFRATAEVELLLWPTVQIRIVPEGGGSDAWAHLSEFQVAGGTISRDVSDGEARVLTVTAPIGEELRLIIPSYFRGSGWEVRLPGDRDYTNAPRGLEFPMIAGGQERELRIRSVNEDIAPIQRDAQSVPSSQPECHYRIDVHSPCTAEVFIDGEMIGTTPVEGVVAAGQHHLELRSENCSNVSLPNFVFPENTPARRFTRTLALGEGSRSTYQDALADYQAGRFQEAKSRALSVPFNSDPQGAREYAEARLLASQILVDQLHDRIQTRKVLVDAARLLPNEPRIALELGVVECQMQLFGAALINLRKAYENADQYSGEIVLYIRNRARFFLGRSYEGLYGQPPPGEVPDAGNCLSAQFWYMEFVGHVNSGDAQLGGLVREAEDRLNHFASHPCQ